ncbi:MAG: T9SS type A sorting domain-containing protein [Bacteroidota bacterium]|nr:T9SS type A sorting domain-containing protein [Bacteroidota bacterium]
MDKFYPSNTLSLLLPLRQYLDNYTILFTPKFYFMRKFTLRILLLLFITTIGTSASFAQVLIAYGSTYSQNFDAMGTSATAPLPAGWKADVQSSIRTQGSYSTAQTTTQYAGSNNLTSSPTERGIYNFGDGTTPSDRSLGGFTSGGNSARTVNLYFAVRNYGAQNITTATVNYTIEKYRNGTNSDGYTVDLYTSATGAAGTWTLNRSTLYPADANDNGFNPAPDPTQTRTVTSLPLTINAGQPLYLAWSISVAPGGNGNNGDHAQALGIDNVNFNTVPSAGFLGLFFQSHPAVGSTGTWSNAADWESSNSSAGPWTYPAPYSPTYTDQNISILNGHTMNIASDVTIDQTTVNAGGTVSINAGKTLSVNDGAGFDLTVLGTVTGAGKLVIQSANTGGDAGTASIGPSQGGIINVSTTVQRLISSTYARNAWRLVTAPLTVTGSIFDNWQNGGTYFAGVGTTISGPTYISATGGAQGTPMPDINGLDFYTAGPTMYTYNATTQDIAPVTNTRTTMLSGTGNIGYYMFFIGDRQATHASPSQTILSATGLLQVGGYSKSISSVANGYALIANPYAAAIDLDKFNAANTSSNIKPSYRYWDPYLSGTYGVGGYVTVSYDQNGNRLVAPANAQFLQSGQAMFVQTNSAGGGSVQFTESQKDPTSVNSVFRTTSTSKTEDIRINLNVILAGSPTIVDGIVASFDKSYSAQVDKYDADKMYSQGENIAFMRDGNALSIERRPVITGDDILYLNLSKLKSGVSYQFEISSSINTTGLTAYLIDNYLKSSIPIDLSKTTSVNFTVNSDPASTGANRFSISFTKTAILTVATGAPAISVFPNPVNNGVINLQLNNMAAGIYNVRVFNSMGQVIASKQINHAAGSSTETIQAKGLSKGIYQLEVVKPDNTKFSNKIMAN